VNGLAASVDGGNDDTGIAVGVKLGACCVGEARAWLLFCGAALLEDAADATGVVADCLEQPRKPQTPATITPLQRANSTRASRMYSIKFRLLFAGSELCSIEEFVAAVVRT
jgi:hypothetical protein